MSYLRMQDEAPVADAPVAEPAEEQKDVEVPEGGADEEEKVEDEMEEI